MVTILLRRVIEALAVLVVVAAGIFMVSRATGDPTLTLLPLEATDAQREEFIRQWGLNEPLWQQFSTWLGNVIQGDFGRSFGARRPVAQLIAQRLPNSLYLAVVAVLISLTIGITAGIGSAVWRGKWPDWLLRGIAVLGQAMPVFWLGLMLQLIFAINLQWFPLLGAEEPLSVLLPAFTLGWFLSAGVMRLTRSAMLEALGSQYSLFARSRGISEGWVIVKHAARNALGAPLTFMGMYLGILLGSAVIVEEIFGWPGIGSLAYSAVLNRDFPVLQAVVLLVTTGVILSSVLVDLIYAVLDPRLRARR